MSFGVDKNDFKIFNEYLYSEIDLRGGIVPFSKDIGLKQDELRKFLRITKKPDLILLAKLLNGLNFSLKIIPNEC